MGGLIQAYKTSAQLTLQEAQIIEKIITKTLIITFDYKDMNKVMRVIKERNLQIINQLMEMNCTLFIEVRHSEFEQTQALFEAIYGVSVVKS